MWTNWSGGQVGRPRATERPLDEAGVVAAVRRAAERGRRIRPVGSGHSWSALAVTDEAHLDCSALTGVVAVENGTVRVRAGSTLHAVLAELAEHELTLAAFPAVDTVTVAGAIATGSHGSGAGAASLSALVTGVRLVDGTGEVRRIAGSDLDAVRTGLGALGVITEIDMAVVADHVLDAREEVHPLDELVADGFLDAHHWAELEVFPDGLALARWADRAEDPDDTVSGQGPVRAVAVGSAQALGRVVPRLAPALRRSAARWSGWVTDRPHRILVDDRPVPVEVGEWAVPRQALGPALRELAAACTARDIRTNLPVQVRVGAAETGWLHPAQGRATAWVAVRSPRGVDPDPLFALVGAVLGGAGGRPHWGTRHDWTAAEVALAYPHLPDFLRVRDRLDPDRRLTNPHLDELLGP